MNGIGTLATQALSGRAWVENELKRRKKYEEALRALGLTIQEAYKATGMNAINGSSGGYAVPAEHVDMLLQAIDARSIVRPRAQVLTGVSPDLSIPSLDYDDTTGTRANVSIAWGSEGATIPQTDPDFGRTRLVARKLVALFKSTNELLQDSSAATILGQLAASAVANWLDQHYLAGSGVGQPLGVLNAPCAIKVARTTATQISKGDIGKMVSHMLPQSIGTAYNPNRSLAWIAHPASAEYIYSNMEIMYTMATLGSPLLYSEHMSTLGNEGDIALVDWNHYLISVTRDLAIDQSTHHPGVFLSDETAFRITMRGDGQPWLNAPIILTNGSHTVSPVVILSDAA